MGPAEELFTEIEVIATLLGYYCVRKHRDSASLSILTVINYEQEIEITYLFYPQSISIWRNNKSAAYIHTDEEARIVIMNLL